MGGPLRNRLLCGGRVRLQADGQLKTGPPPVEDLFDYAYAELPPALEQQKRTLRTDSIGQDPSQVGLQPHAAATQETVS